MIVVEVEAESGGGLHRVGPRGANDVGGDSRRVVPRQVIDDPPRDRHVDGCPKQVGKADRGMPVTSRPQPAAEQRRQPRHGATSKPARSRQRPARRQSPSGSPRPGCPSEGGRRGRRRKSACGPRGGSAVRAQPEESTCTYRVGPRSGPPAPGGQPGYEARRIDPGGEHERDLPGQTHRVENGLPVGFISRNP